MIGWAEAWSLSPMLDKIREEEIKRKKLPQGIVTSVLLHFFFCLLMFYMKKKEADSPEYHLFF